MYGYHFLRDDEKLNYPPHTLVEEGQKLEAVDRELEICQYGLHASSRIMDALRYAPGSILCRVQLSGKVLTDTDKSCAEYRRCIWMFDTTTVLHKFACWCAEEALTRVGITDDRCWDAIKTKRLWLKGEASDSELEAAWAAAWAAAGAAAGYAARAAAWDAARAAAWDAARAAAEEQEKQLQKMVAAARKQ